MVEFRIGVGTSSCQAWWHLRGSHPCGAWEVPAAAGTLPMRMTDLGAASAWCSERRRGVPPTQISQACVAFSEPSRGNAADGAAWSGGQRTFQVRKATRMRVQKSLERQGMVGDKLGGLWGGKGWPEVGPVCRLGIGSHSPEGLLWVYGRDTRTASE